MVRSGISAKQEGQQQNNLVGGTLCTTAEAANGNYWDEWVSSIQEKHTTAL